MATQTITSAIAQFVSELHRKQGLSQMQLADLSGIARTTMQRRLGDGDFSITELGKIAAVLDTTPQQIVTGASDIANAHAA